MSLASRILSFALTLTLTLTLGYAQTTADLTVQISATVQASPAQITLHWPQDPAATSYAVYRKAAGAVGWGSTLATLGAADTTFTDPNVAVGDAWEYRISKTATGYSGLGYCYAGIERPVRDYMGKLILVIDTTYAQNLASEIDRLIQDLWGDGWQVIKLPVDRADSVTGVHDRIQAEWTADPVNVRSVLLLGHVPVPYSGNLNPDGHPDHQGAWPADVYYGEMNGQWTDMTVNNSNASRPANQNTLGDGKFDQSNIPSDVDLEVGRIDFANMPVFVVGEEALLRRYLDKDHAWRMKEFTVQDSAVVDDNFGVFGGEAFATSGWRNFAPMVGARHVYAGDFRTDLNARDHLWAYGCGGGWYQGAGGIGASSDFAGDSLRGVFTMVFGSYHGDWDSDDNFLRAALASKGHILSCAWAGRPNWHVQHMGLGEPIGYAAKLTQNNFSTYLGGYGARGVHIALMGDPSLRMHVCAPPTNLTVTLANGGNAHELNWTPSPEAILRYIIYRQDTLDGRFWRIATTGLNTATYTDSCMQPGDYRYMVRAEELRTGYSGSYHNLSQGAIGSITNASMYALQTDALPTSTYCAGDTVQVAFATIDDFCSGNLFTVEFSDSTGDFAQASTIGSMQAFSSGTIVCIIPANASPATGYRIRVNASNPSATGIDNGADLQILGLPVADFSLAANGLTLALTNQSTNAATYFWTFGDGNSSTLASPAYTYAAEGNYTVQLVVVNACGTDTFTQSTTLVGVDAQMEGGITIFPNPAQDHFEIKTSHPQFGPQQVHIRNVLGQQIQELQWNGSQSLRIETAHWPRGVYTVEIASPKSILRRKIVVE